MKHYQIVSWVIIIGLMLAVQPLDRAVEYDRLVLGLQQPTPWFQIAARGATGETELAVTGVTGVIVGAALGGFREVAATMLWMKTHEYWESGQALQVKALWLMRLVTLLDPHWLEPWRITAWHLAYNLYVETDDPALQSKYLQMGVDCLKEGVSWNPDRYDLYVELGWTYFDKVEDFEEAAKWFEASKFYPHPEYVDRLVGHAYERMPDLPRALDAYDYCLKRDPTDGTAKGATITIRERYLHPWYLMEEGQHDKALGLIDTHLLAKPDSTLALHVKGYLAEQAGDTRLAYETWKRAGDGSALDFHAQRRAVELAHQLGIATQDTPQYIYMQRQARTQQKRMDGSVPGRDNLKR